MTADRDETRIVRSWLEDGVTMLPDRVLDAVLDQLPATPQRRAGWLVWRSLNMNGFARFAAISAALAILIIGVFVATRPNSVGPTPTESPTPTPTPPPLLNQLPTGVLPAGTYQIDAVFPVRLSFTLPAGFDHGRGAPDGVGIGHPGSGMPRGIEYQIASNVFPDPCHNSSGPASPATGPSVDDLVTAMTTMIGVEAGPVTDVMVGGLPAKAFDLTTEIDAETCDGGAIRTFEFAGSSGIGGIGPGQRQRIYVMDAQDTRLMIMTYYFPDGDVPAETAVSEEMRSIVDSIQFR